LSNDIPSIIGHFPIWTGGRSSIEFDSTGVMLLSTGDAILKTNLTEVALPVSKLCCEK